MKNEDNLIKLRPCHDFMHRSCFTGLELVDWLIQNGDVSHRGQAVLLGRELLDQGIIKHGKWELKLHSQTKVTGKFNLRCNAIIYLFFWLHNCLQGLFVCYLIKLLTSVTDEFHFRDENIFYLFMIDNVVNKKLINALGIVDEKITCSPRNFKQRNFLPFSSQCSSPVPFTKERQEVNERSGKLKYTKIG